MSIDKPSLEMQFGFEIAKKTTTLGNSIFIITVLW